MKTLIGILLVTAAFAAEPKEIPLYPGAAPGSENATYAEQQTIGPQDNIRRISNITHPVLLAYLPESAKATGTASSGSRIGQPTVDGNGGAGSRALMGSEVQDRIRHVGGGNLGLQKIAVLVIRGQILQLQAF